MTLDTARKLGAVKLLVSVLLADFSYQVSRLTTNVLIPVRSVSKDPAG